MDALIIYGRVHKLCNTLIFNRIIAPISDTNDRAAVGYPLRILDFLASILAGVSSESLSRRSHKIATFEDLARPLPTTTCLVYRDTSLRFKWRKVQNNLIFYEL